MREKETAPFINDAAGQTRGSRQIRSNQSHLLQGSWESPFSVLHTA